MSDEPWLQRNWVDHTQILLNSFEHWLGRPLLFRQGSLTEQARDLYFAPFIVVSHGTEPDPILNYGNEQALTLWDTEIDSLCSMPSRLTAEPVHRDERARLMAKTAEQGYVDDYMGVRISRLGRRFFIEQAIVWNLLDDTGHYAGQAATFDRWQYLDEQTSS